MIRRARVKPFVALSALLLGLAAVGLPQITRGEPGAVGRSASTSSAKAVSARGGTASARASATAEKRPPSPSGESKGTFVDVMSEEGQRARGLYITYPYLNIFKVKGVIAMLQHSHLDTAIIDLKDDRGRISFRTNIETYKPQVVGEPVDMPKVVEELHKAGLRAVARIVCFNDNQLARREPDRAILDGRPKYAGKQKVWTSWGTGTTWLNPYNKKNHDLFVQFATEAESMGFDEVQLDYIRFPVDAGTQYALYEPSSEELRRFVILDMLRRIDAAIKIPLGVDVFGLTAIRNGDPTGLGQSLTDWTAHIEVFGPMLYVNAMQGWREDVPDRGHVLVKGPIYILRQRVGRGPILRPFMQAFENGLKDAWNPDFIVQEITGARMGGADGFMFWNPGSNYGMVMRGVAKLEKGLMPFPLAGRDKFREELWARGENELSPKSERNTKAGW